MVTSVSVRIEKRANCAKNYKPKSGGLFLVNARPFPEHSSSIATFSAGRAWLEAKQTCARVRKLRTKPWKKKTWAPVYPHMLSISHSQDGNFCWFFTICIRNPAADVLGNGLKREEEDESYYRSHPRHIHAWKIDQPVGIPGTGLHRTKYRHKRKRQAFFFGLALKINACRGWETEKLTIVPLNWPQF